MPECMISGIPVNFPFEPYDVQKAYMEKVIECLRDGSNGVLESPTGTGKTLSLLCASLAWLLSRKSEVKIQIKKNSQSHISLSEELATVKGNNWGIPKIIYASRTHSQLAQAMQELKQTSYSFMRSVVLGSRDQLCIHPDVMKEQGNSNKIQLCKLRVQTRTCTFYSRVESKKDHPEFREPTIMDIEDLVTVGQKLKMCPYFGAKELIADADITFMPYNYLLDPKARKANKIELNNTIIILDEAHNIEKICEDSASVQIRSSDIALAIDDLTGIMKALSSDPILQDNGDEKKDFNLEDLAFLKEMLLNLEKVVDDIPIANKTDGATFPALYMFEMLAKVNLTQSIAGSVTNLLEKLIQFLAVNRDNTSFRKGHSFEILSDLLTIVFVNKEEQMHKVYKSFKVHVQIEETKQTNSRDAPVKDGWLSKASTNSTLNNAPKVINYWCFNPGFGMEQLLNNNVRSVILTSGTLAPLKPLIAELSIPIAHRLENPHIVSKSQVYVKIIGSGPDREQLISNYTNRDNPKYIRSLGQTILNVARIVPDGLLIFFPSYPLLNQCVNSWQASGLWYEINRIKPIFVEPRNKDDFVTTMEEFYESIRTSKGACFMAVCRGKVSEGLDFADRNGRAVIITGLPFPPLKDPKVILKKRYLEDNRTKENELLSGQEWYNLDATRAVNQAIGRVIRHRSDYGAILLCDSRFQYPSQVQQLSKWIRGHLGTSPKSSPFGPIVRELKEFFKNAEQNCPKPKERSVDQLVSESCEEVGVVRSSFFSNPKEVLNNKIKLEYNKNSSKLKIDIENANSIESWSPADYASAIGRKDDNNMPSAMDFMSRLNSNVSTIDFNAASNANTSTNSVSNDLVNIHKRKQQQTITSSERSQKKRYKISDQTIPIEKCDSNDFKSNETKIETDSQLKTNEKERTLFLKEIRNALSSQDYLALQSALQSYKVSNNFEELVELLVILFAGNHMHLLKQMRRFIRVEHREKFDERLKCTKL